MPIDYSKFDNIGDSDEEEPPKSAAITPYGGGYPSAPPPAPAVVAPSAIEKRVGRNGRELLEPVGVRAIQGLAAPTSSGKSGPEDPMIGLAEQLELLAGKGGKGGGKGSAPEEQPRKPGEPQRLCVRADGLKKIHTTYADGAEMVEEYDDKTDVLLTRKTRRAYNATLGREMEWITEVGQVPTAAFDPHADLMRASTSNPIFLRKDTPDHFQWRIRNLAFPANVYSVTVDHEKQHIVVRTTNKKYFKRIELPDLERLKNIKLKDELLTWKHQHSTLIISYTKPPEVLKAEKETLKEAEKLAMKM